MKSQVQGLKFNNLDQQYDQSWEVQKWLTILDAVRGIAALSVVVSHSISVNPDSEEIITKHFHWLASGGVTLFFVLSGFCIHLPHARRLTENPVATVDWQQFFYRRAQRLLPTHYVSLILSAILGLYVQSNLISRPTWAGFITHIFMVHVWSGLFLSINGVFWSIAVEVHFYLAYPFYLRFRKLIGSFRVPFVLLVIGLMIYFLASQFTGTTRFVGQNLFLVTWWQWAWGAFLAEWYVQSRHRISNLFFTFPFAPGVWGGIALLMGAFDPVLFRLHVRYWLLPIFCGLLIGSLVIRKDLKWRGLAWIGAFSYSLYLTHPLVLAVLPQFLSASRSIIAVVSVTCSIFFAWLFYLIVEKHFLNIHLVIPKILKDENESLSVR